ncbi:hypothetical protein IE81DRAFT_325220 [Ceraceosorus guamensis]|uniref:Uncharacterized protein n=1 Tax=Ceraceosorus guamensis TaxID=1522189 RepID=A0A316VTE4_9BASI|nr:hypothetical protein IE81DRAFT_325220 [Ceraceosorus guamensis]PWN40762.1 hypothetical protein IE81DRAFT_325220 [Ceraceosorus guamensis]
MTDSLRQCDLPSGLLSPYSAPQKGLPVLPSVELPHTWCFCGNPISTTPASSSRSTASTASEDEDEEGPIYCSRACARADALSALMASSKCSGPNASSIDMVPGLSTSSTSSNTSEGPMTPCNLPMDLPDLGAHYSEHEGLERRKLQQGAASDNSNVRASKARVMARASAALSQMYPELQFDVDVNGDDTKLRLSHTLPDKSLPSLPFDLQAASHYRRVQALRPVAEYSPSVRTRSSSFSSDSSEDRSDCSSSRQCSTSAHHAEEVEQQQFVSTLGYVRDSVYSPVHSSPEREQARLRALGAPALARARHALKDAHTAEELPQRQYRPTESLELAMSNIARLNRACHHGHSNSDASDLSSMTASTDTSFNSALTSEDADAQSSGTRSRSTSVNTIERPTLFCANPDEPLSPNVKLRDDIAALDRELNRHVADAFEFWSDLEEESEGPRGMYEVDDRQTWGHDNPLGFDRHGRGTPSAFEHAYGGNVNSLGLDLGSVAIGSAKLPECEAFSDPRTNLCAPLQSSVLSDATRRAAPLTPRRGSSRMLGAPLPSQPLRFLSPPSQSVFEPESPLLPTQGISKTAQAANSVTSAFNSMMRKDSFQSIKTKSASGLGLQHTCKEDAQADKLIKRLDNALRSRLSSLRSPPPAPKAELRSLSPIGNMPPKLTHKRSKNLFGLVA